MRTSFRGPFAVLLIGVALAAAAMAPAHTARAGSQDFVGDWITWSGAEDGGTPVCRRLRVTAASAATRGGTWDAPGWNGLVKATLSPVKNGARELRGEWRDGQIAGSFALTLREGGALEGTFAGAGLPRSQHWQGRRDTGRGPRDVPCVFRG
jgi:hypothetical protein